MKQLMKVLTGIGLLCASQLTLAATGGGATIHNAATLSFSGGQVVAHVDVEVLTIGSVPTFTAVSEAANAGDSVNVTYTITSTSNGSDIYDLAVSSNDTDVSAPPALTVTPPQVTLGGSITSRPSTGGTIYIAAGSESELVAGDIVRINIGGTDYQYEIGTVTSGTPAFTAGSITTPEVATAITLTPVGPAPAIIAGNVPAGSQIGEVQTIIVSLTTGTPTTPGVGGNHEIVIDGTAATPGPGGPVTFSDIGTGNVSVLSGNASLTKEVRNVTEGGGFATSGVAARSGDVLEYRLTASSIPGETVTGATLTDTLPEFTTYVANSTTLNGAPVADIGPDSPLLTGMPVNSTGGAAGEILDGETAIVTFQVTVE